MGYRETAGTGFSGCCKHSGSGHCDLLSDASQKTEKKLYTEEIRKSAEKARKANEAKTRFLFNMSHDIRTPMNAIVGFSGLLEKSLHDEKKSLGYIKRSGFPAIFC